MTAAALDLIVTACFCLLGLAMWARPVTAPAVLMVATGLTWAMGDIGTVFLFAHRGPLIHLLVIYPRKRLPERAERVVVAFGYLDAAIYPLGRVDMVTLGLATLVLGVIGYGRLAAGGAERRARLTSLAAAAGVLGSLAVGAGARLTGHPFDHSLLVVYEVTLAAAAVAMYADQRWGRWNRSAITSLVLDLGNAEQSTPLRDQLAAALGDPSLQVGYPAPDLDALVDETGHPLELPPPTPDRPVTVVRQDDRAVAVLAHDRAVLDDPVLLTGVTDLAKIALINARLQADIVAATSGIEASRRRLLVVADVERQQMEAELRSGAQSRLRFVESLLLEEPSRPELHEQVRACREAVSDFARGVHPHALTEHGLSAALSDLARAAPVPVEIDIPTGRFSAEVEVAAYYVCAEALTNVAKYARADAARVRIADAGLSLIVEIVDDGVGGAAIGGGSGLVGLADRLDVLGGSLAVDSRRGRGTAIRAVIPLVTR